MYQVKKKNAIITTIALSLVDPVNVGLVACASEEVQAVVDDVVVEAQGPPDGIQAAFTTTPTSGRVSLTVQFDASTSEGDNLIYTWDFGNGETATGQQISYTFTEAEHYNVTLTVENDDGQDTASQVVVAFSEDAMIQIEGDPNDPALQALPVFFNDHDLDLEKDFIIIDGYYFPIRLILVTFMPSVTIGEANMLIADLQGEIVGADPGHPDAEQYQLGGLTVYLRVPEQSLEELEEFISGLNLLPRVWNAVPVFLDGPSSAVPNPTSENAWDVPEQGGNWGTEISRVPTMWNLNALAYNEGVTTFTVAAEKGFEIALHPDLGGVINLTPPNAIMFGFSQRDKDHGNQVLGIMGAKYGNEVGVAGINPFSSVAFMPQSITGVRERFIEATEMDSQLIRVINYSNGVRPAFYSYVDGWGQDFLRMMQALWGVNLSSNPTDWPTYTYDANGILEQRVINFRPPLYVPAAGNDNGALASARSLVANAALVQIPKYTAQTGIDIENNIIVVENINMNKELYVGYELFGVFIFDGGSNIGGDISAPGTDIKSTIAIGYKEDTGTSLSAPHVSGLASYMFSLDPNLTASEVRQIILDNTVNDVIGSVEINNEIIDVKPRMDAFASVMAIDSFRGNRRFLTALLDIDDNTLDGNQRVG